MKKKRERERLRLIDRQNRKKQNKKKGRKLKKKLQNKRCKVLILFHIVVSIFLRLFYSKIETMLKETRSLQSDLNKRGFRDKDRDISRAACKMYEEGSEEGKGNLLRSCENKRKHVSTQHIRTLEVGFVITIPFAGGTDQIT